MCACYCLTRTTPTCPPQGVPARLLELLERIWHPGPTWFHTRGALAVELLTKALACVDPKRSPNDPRDEFCYKQLKRKRSLAQLMLEVNEREDWERLESEQAVSQAAKRYASRRSLVWPLK
jgi:hypothetical protein